MATKIRIELNHDGIKELLLSDAIGGEVKKAAEGIASRAGEGFKVVGPQGLGYGGGRVGYGVVAATYEAKLAEAENKALSKAVR